MDVIEQMEADHREHVAALIRQSNFREAGLHTALRTETEKVERLEAQLVGAVADVQRLQSSLEILAERIERDRREPDKILCYVLDMRRAAASGER